MQVVAVDKVEEEEEEERETVNMPFSNFGWFHSIH